MGGRISGPVPRPSSDDYVQLHGYYSQRQKNDRVIFVIKSGDHIETHSYNKFHAFFANLYHKCFSEGEIFRGNDALKALENAAKQKFEHQVSDFKRIPLGQPAKATGLKISSAILAFASDKAQPTMAPLQKMTEEVHTQIKKHEQFEEFEGQLAKEFPNPAEKLQANLKFLAFLKDNENEVDPKKFREYQARLRKSSEECLVKLGQQVKDQDPVSKTAVEEFAKGHAQLQEAEKFGIPADPLKEGLQTLQKNIVDGRKGLHEHNREELGKQIREREEAVAGNSKKMEELSSRVGAADKQREEFLARREVVLGKFAALSQNPSLASKREDIGRQVAKLNSGHVTEEDFLHAEALIKELRSLVNAKMPQDLPGTWKSDEEAKKISESHREATEKFESLQFFKKFAPQAKVVKGMRQGAIKDGFSTANLKKVKGLDIGTLKADWQYKELIEMLNDATLESKDLVYVADLITTLTRKFPQLSQVQKEIHVNVFNTFARKVPVSEGSFHQPLWNSFKGDGPLRKAMQRSIDMADSETMNIRELRTEAERSGRLLGVIEEGVQKSPEELRKDIFDGIEGLRRNNPGVKHPLLVKQRGESDDQFFSRMAEGLQSRDTRRALIEELLKPSLEPLKKRRLTPDQEKEILDVQRGLIRDQLDVLALQINILQENKGAKMALVAEFRAVTPALDEMEQLVRDTRALPGREKERAIHHGETGRLREENEAINKEIERLQSKLKQMEEGRAVFDIGSDVLLTPEALQKFVNETNLQIATF